MSETTYNGLHQRLRSQRGSAASEHCAMCQSNQARDWAYDHSGVEERADPQTGAMYSLDLSRYIPLCRACHRWMDRLRTPERFPQDEPPGATENRAKTECIHGHTFSEENTYIKPNGTRACKACVRDRKRAMRERSMA